MAITPSGLVGVGTTSPYAMLSVAGGVALPGIANGAGTAYVCTTLATGVLSTSTTACNPSSLRFKNNIKDLSYGLSEVLKLKPVSFTYKPDMLVPGPQIGFIAEDMINVVPEVVGLDSQGLPANIDYGKMTPVLTKAIQELDGQFQALVATSTASSTPASQSFAGSFFQSLFARITAWLADAGNGITDLFAKNVYATNVTAQTGNFHQVTADDVCAKKSDGTSVCVTGDQLAALLGATAAADTTGSVSSSASNSSGAPPQKPSPDLTNSGNPNNDNSSSINSSTPDATSSLPVVDAPPLVPDYNADTAPRTTASSTAP